MPALLAPNAPALAGAAGVATLEAALAGRAAAFAGPGDAVAAWLVLAALWLVVVALLVAAARAAARLPRPLRIAAGLLAAVVLAGAVFFHAIGWAYRFQSGDFVGVDAARFALRDLAGLLHYLRAAQPGALWTVGLGSVAAGAGAAALLPPLARRGWRAGAAPAPARWAVLALLAAGVALTAPSRGVRLDPAVAFTVDASRAPAARPIRPVLAHADLVPLAATPRVPPPPADGPRRHVLLVAVESLRPDVIGLVHAGSLVMPRLTALAATGRLFRRTWATSTQSNYSDPSVASSLYPLRTRDYLRYAAADPWPRTLLWDVLKPAGYATAVISSQNESWGGMHAFLATPALDLFYDPERQPGNVPSHVSRRDLAMMQALESGELNAGSFHDEHTVDVAIDWLRRRRDRPFVLAMNLQASHFPYALPEGWRPPYEPAMLDPTVRFFQPPAEKLPLVRIAYWNALRYADEQIGRLLDALAADGRLDETVIAVYGENGESFGEGGRALHAAEPVEAALRVACLLRAPGSIAPGVDDYPTTLIDVVPTILARLGYPPHPGFQGIDVLGPGRPPAEERLLFAHVNTPLAGADVVVQGGRWKFTYDARAFAERLADLAADPLERRNLVDAEPAIARRLRGALDAWRERQLAYYAFPFYHRAYWPPAPPALAPGGGSSPGSR